jgi:hypothetical protein
MFDFSTTNGYFVSLNQFTISQTGYVAGNPNIEVNLYSPDSFDDNVGDSYNGKYFQVSGTPLVYEQPTPAPVPGAGPLSYLVMAIAVLWFRRKTLLAQVGSLAGRLSSWGVMRKCFPRPARAQPLQRPT